MQGSVSLSSCPGIRLQESPLDKKTEQALDYFGADSKGVCCVRRRPCSQHSSPTGSWPGTDFVGDFFIVSVNESCGCISVVVTCTPVWCFRPHFSRGEPIAM